MELSAAYPVFRAPDTKSALTVASRLARCGSVRGHPAVFVNAELANVADALKARTLFPGGWYSFGDSHVRMGDLPGDGEAVARLLPGEVDVEEVVDESALRRFLPLTAPGACGHLTWAGLSWPAVPGLGLGPQCERAGVQLCINSTVDYKRVLGNTVYVHMRPGEAERAHDLAHRVGQAVLGPAEGGW
ncbi:hypothetical protein ABZ883_12430 [Streptomyces sp. NPDC046977]|uniref:hypothetical protein n=1 Tax=Streptomyces sp. NPDC046977 TaxID=3154703 RepID=UPI0033D67514